MLERRSRRSVVRCDRDGLAKVVLIGLRVTAISEHDPHRDLATQLLCDAFLEAFDAAMIMSSERDIAPAIRVVVDELKLPVFVAFPPKRLLDELKVISSGLIHVNRQPIGESQYPGEFEHEGGTCSRDSRGGLAKERPHSLGSSEASQIGTLPESRVPALKSPHSSVIAD